MLKGIFLPKLGSIKVHLTFKLSLLDEINLFEPDLLQLVE